MYWLKFVAMGPDVAFSPYLVNGGMENKLDNEPYLLVLRVDMEPSIKTQGHELVE